MWLDRFCCDDDIGAREQFLIKIYNFVKKYPSAAHFLAIERPIPRDAPVINILFKSSKWSLWLINYESEFKTQGVCELCKYSTGEIQTKNGAIHMMKLALDEFQFRRLRWLIHISILLYFQPSKLKQNYHRTLPYSLLIFLYLGFSCSIFTLAHGGRT